MTLTTRLAAAALALAFSSLAIADFDRGLAAYKAKDFDRAFTEFQADAQAGNPMAQFNLGVMYYRGEGIDKDFVKAYAWIDLATQTRGNEDLEEAHGVLSVMLDSEQIREANALAAKLSLQYGLNYRPSGADTTRMAGR